MRLTFRTYFGRDGKHRRIRSSMLIVLLLAASAFIWVALVTSKVLAPTLGTGRHADAVISLAPSDSRLPTAVYLYSAGEADELAISWFPSRLSYEIVTPEWALLEDLNCRNATRDDIHCFTPEIDSTYGEALSVKKLVEERGWESITVVTNRYHVFRSEFIFEHVLPPTVDVEVIASPTDVTVIGWLRHVIYENAAFVKAIFETKFG